MNWLTLSPIEVAGLWAAASGVALWFYLHHRRPVRKRVSTLRFWASAESVPQLRRRRLREPWAFVAQVLFLLFILLALANPRWGTESESRGVVMVLDASLWSQMRPANQAPWIDQVRQAALRFVNALPSGDRVLLLRAEADAPPVLPFTTDRGALRAAIAGLRPSNTIADIPRALGLAKSALAGSRRGLVVYVGPGMLDDQQEQGLDDFRTALEQSRSAAPGSGDRPQFLVRLIGDQGPVENRGIIHLALRRDAAQPDHWHLLADLRNYGLNRSPVILRVAVGDHTLLQQAAVLAPGEVLSTHGEFTWAEGGLLKAEISPPDALDADNRAVAYLPSFSPVHVAVFSAKGRLASELRPVLSTDPYVRAEYLSPGSAPAAKPDVAIYDEAGKAAESSSNSILFVQGKPLTPPRSVRVLGWNAEHPVTRWVRTRDVSVRNPASIETRPGDLVLASAEGNPPAPLILAREQGGHKQLIVGFDPRDSNFPEQAAFPLLIAGAIEWMTHPIEDTSASFSAGELDLTASPTRIVAPSGHDTLFAREGQDIRFVASEIGMYRLISGNSQTNLAVNTPPLPSQRWQPNASEEASIAREPFQRTGRDLWKWFVMLAILALWAERWLFYRHRNRQNFSDRQLVDEDKLRRPESGKKRRGSLLHSLRFFG